MLGTEESIAELMLREFLDGLAPPSSIEMELLDARHDATAGAPWPPPADSLDDAGGGDGHGPDRSAAPPDSGAAAECPAPGVTTGASSGGARVSETAGPGDEVVALAAALEAVARQDPASLDGAQALARTRWLLQATERLKALSVQALADVETRALYTLDDAPTVTAWVKSLAVQGVDSGDVTLSRRLRRVPRIAEEIQAGRMSTRTGAVLSGAVSKARPFLDRPDGLIDGLDGEQVLSGTLVDGVCQLVAEQIGAAADADLRLAALRAALEQLNDPSRTQLDRWESALVLLAQECDPALLASGIALLVDALLPQEHDRRARKAEDERGLALRRHDSGSGWHVKGDLDDETGELLATVLDAAAATDPDSPQDTSRHAAGQAALDDPTLAPADWPVEQPAPRSRAQQRHDAFKRGLRVLFDSGALGVRGKAAPHVAVTVGLDFVEGLPGSLPARTDHGARLSREQVRRLICRGTFTRLVLDATNRVVNVSHTQRTSTALERLILKTQSGVVCSRGGCARGPATGHRLIPHHASLFSRTGRTEIADTVLFCEPDHDHELHDKRRTLRLKDGRVLGPDGWVRP